MGAIAWFTTSCSMTQMHNLATGRIVWFVRELDRWWRGEETHTERAWGDAAVRAALDGAGLALIGRYDPTGGVAAEDALRVVYVAQLEQPKLWSA